MTRSRLTCQETLVGKSLAGNAWQEQLGRKSLVGKACLELPVGNCQSGNSVRTLCREQPVRTPLAGNDCQETSPRNAVRETRVEKYRSRNSAKNPARNPTENAVETPRPKTQVENPCEDAARPANPPSDAAGRPRATVDGWTAGPRRIRAGAHWVRSDAARGRWSGQRSGWSREYENGCLDAQRARP